MKGLFPKKLGFLELFLPVLMFVLLQTISDNSIVFIPWDSSHLVSGLTCSLVKFIKLEMCNRWQTFLWAVYCFLSLLVINRCYDAMKFFFIEVKLSISFMDMVFEMSWPWNFQQVLQDLVHVAFAGLSSRGYMAEKGRMFYFSVHTN